MTLTRQAGNYVDPGADQRVELADLVLKIVDQLKKEKEGRCVQLFEVIAKLEGNGRGFLYGFQSDLELLGFVVKTIDDSPGSAIAVVPYNFRKARY